MAGWMDGADGGKKKEKKRREREKERRRKEKKNLFVWWQEKCECCIVLLRFMYLLWFKAGEYGCLVKVSRGELQFFRRGCIAKVLVWRVAAEYGTSVVPDKNPHHIA